VCLILFVRILFVVQLDTRYDRDSIGWWYSFIVVNKIVGTYRLQGNQVKDVVHWAVSLGYRLIGNDSR
jgi:hypothetical protein